MSRWGRKEGFSALEFLHGRGSVQRAQRGEKRESGLRAANQRPVLRAAGDRFAAAGVQQILGKLTCAANFRALAAFVCRDRGLRRLAAGVGGRTGAASGRRRRSCFVSCTMWARAVVTILCAWARSGRLLGCRCCPEEKQRRKVLCASSLLSGSPEPSAPGPEPRPAKQSDPATYEGRSGGAAAPICGRQQTTQARPQHNLCTLCIIVVVCFRIRTIEMLMTRPSPFEEFESLPQPNLLEGRALGLAPAVGVDGGEIGTEYGWTGTW